jgi:gas vesicle protein
LTHRGIREVEDAQRYPNLPTEHFSPNTINNVIKNYGTMYNPTIQQGTSNSNQTATITQQQHESIIEAISQIKEIVQQQGRSNPDEKREELEQEIANAELESKLKMPKWERLKEYLTCIKNIAEAVALQYPWYQRFCHF